MYIDTDTVFFPFLLCLSAVYLWEYKEEGRPAAHFWIKNGSQNFSIFSRHRSEVFTFIPLAVSLSISSLCMCVFAHVLHANTLAQSAAATPFRPPPPIFLHHSPGGYWRRCCGTNCRNAQWRARPSCHGTAGVPRRVWWGQIWRVPVAVPFMLSEFIVVCCHCCHCCCSCCCCWLRQSFALNSLGGEK